jgi:hypothetical protein
MPATPGIRPAVLLGRAAAAPRPAPAGPRMASARPEPVVVAAPPPPPTVEIIRGDKRAQEVVRQE